MVDNMAVAEVKGVFSLCFQVSKAEGLIVFLYFLSVMVVAADASFFFFLCKCSLNMICVCVRVRVCLHLFC